MSVFLFLNGKTDANHFPYEMMLLLLSLGSRALVMFRKCIEHVYPICLEAKLS